MSADIVCTYCGQIGHRAHACPRRILRSHHWTRRQRDVLGLLADGESNKDIGRLLGIAEATVEAHLTNIRNVFGADMPNRKLVALAASVIAAEHWRQAA